MGVLAGSMQWKKLHSTDFKAIADVKGIHYEARQEQCDITLMIVEVEGVKISDD